MGNVHQKLTIDLQIPSRELLIHCLGDWVNVYYCLIQIMNITISSENIDDMKTQTSLNSNVTHRLATNCCGDYIVTYFNKVDENSHSQIAIDSLQNT